MGRWIRFFLVFAVGLVLGLVYGWVVNPVQYVDTTPDTLRVDYRSDYALMVAEVYHAERDLAAAARRLALLGDTPPAEIARQAMIFGSQAPYGEADMQLLARLTSDLQNWNPLQGAPPEGATQP